MKQATVLALVILVGSLSVVTGCRGTPEAPVATVTATQTAETPSTTEAPSRTATPTTEATATPAASPTPTVTQSPEPVETETAERTPVPVTPTMVIGPRITALTASPTDVAPGEPITVTWDTHNAETASRTLCVTVNDQADTRTCSEVPASGSRTIVTEEGDALYEFVLDVAAEGNLKDNRLAFVCLDVDWFFENPPDRCAATQPLRSDAAAQRFEYGMMIWIEETDEFLVLVDDNSQLGRFLYIFAGPLELEAGASVDNRVEDVPEGYLQPVSGFGLIWRGEIEAEGADTVRDALGWAIEPEFGFETTYQYGRRPFPIQIYRFLRGPDGEIIHIFDEVSLSPRWIIWDGQ